MYKIGVVSAVDPAKCRARVSLPERGVETYWLEVLQPNAWKNHDYHLPDVGEMVAVILDDREEAGCILGAIYTDEHQPPSPGADVRRVTFDDGAVVEYDRAAKKLTITTSGDVAVTATNVAVNATNAHITAALKVTGNSETTGTSQLTGNVTVGGGAEQVALATKTSTALTTLKSAISAAPVVPLDGGASFKAALVTALAAWPPSLAATKLSSD